MKQSSEIGKDREALIFENFLYVTGKTCWNYQSDLSFAKMTYHVESFVDIHDLFFSDLFRLSIALSNLNEIFV